MNGLSLKAVKTFNVRSAKIFPSPYVMLPHQANAIICCKTTIPTMQCQLCQRVARALHPNSGYRVPKYYDTRRRRFVELGSWEEIQRNQSCPTCSRIADLFNVEFQINGCDPRSAKYQFWLFDFSSKYLDLRLESESQAFWPSFTINPLSRGSSDRVGVLMDQCWLDLERVLQWVKSCDTMHGECHCPISASDVSFSSRDMYLISVSRKCLVKGNGGEKYVALSYVWGAELSRFRTMKANLPFLQRKGSLSNRKIQDHLPGTIRRAMHFVSLLDVDLLWVDCLCIVQDDPVHTASQIDSMASIYSNSYLTLCAADGVDAESGLLGIRQCSQPRNVRQDILAFADGSVTSEWVKWMRHEALVYDERGWTFQEQVLSRRTLSFTKNGLEWRCQMVSSYEQSTEIERRRNYYTDLNIVRADTLWPCLKKWDNLVSSYLERRLTYEEDILRAFSGILEALGGSMSGGFHFGLPQQFFDAALLWIPEEHLTRRENTENGIVKSTFPSWSWAGWKGARVSQINAFGLGHERSNPLISYKLRVRDIHPCVTWFKIDINTSEKVRIPNDYARFRDDGLLGTITLPLGWSSHQDEHGSLYYYEYDSAPSSYTFWYPIPAPRSIQPESDRQWGPVLYCKTLRGYLEMGSSLSQEEQSGRTYPMHSLNTSEGNWAGVIYLHRPPEGTNEQNQQCELVLISGGFAVEDDEEQSDWIPEWNFAKRPRAGDFYYFYHVLWIEWQGNVAYRRGLGRVVQRVWDDLSKDEVEIFLG